MAALSPLWRAIRRMVDPLATTSYPLAGAGTLPGPGTGDRTSRLIRGLDITLSELIELYEQRRADVLRQPLVGAPHRSSQRPA